MEKRKILIGIIIGASILVVILAILLFSGSGDPSSYQSYDDQSASQTNQQQPPSQALEGNKIFPKELLGLELSQYVDGEAAIASIGQLHGTNVGTKEGYIASYQDQAQSKAITIWISVDPADKAEQLFNIMDGKISNNKNTPFTGRTELDIDGQKVINVQGMGQEHFYWVSGERNIWVAFGGFGNAKEALKEVLNILK